VVSIAAIILATLPSLVGAAAAPTLALQQADITAVQAAITSGTLQSSVPSNLTPSLAEISADEPVTSGDGCHLGYLQTEQTKPCVYGDPAGTRALVLAGDSHAQQWFPAFEAAAKQHHWRLVTWTKAACPLAAHDVHSPELRRPYTECTTWREGVIEKITDLRPDIVVIGQSDSGAQGRGEQRGLG
jgi:hypothetical protein